MPDNLNIRVVHAYLLLHIMHDIRSGVPITRQFVRDAISNMAMAMRQLFDRAAACPHVCVPYERIPLIRYETERLILIPPTPEHETELLKVHNDSQVQEMVFDNVPQAAADVCKWLDWFFTQWRKNGFGDWMVYEKCSPRPIFIGRCGLRDYENTNNLELATSPCEHARGRGLALEAARFAVGHALRSSKRKRFLLLLERRIRQRSGEPRNSGCATSTTAGMLASSGSITK